MSFTERLEQRAAHDVFDIPTPSPKQSSRRASHAMGTRFTPEQFGNAERAGAPGELIRRQEGVARLPGAMVQGAEAGRDAG